MDLELAHIAFEDREYVAAEMNAFLTSWLSRLECAVLNRPQGTCLCGPNWRPLQWVQAASRVGIPVERVRCSVPAADQHDTSSGLAGDATVEVTVVGKWCFGAPSENYVENARRLAEFARTPLIAVRFRQRFGSPHFVSATAMPSLKKPEIASAVGDLLLSGSDAA
jgi:hypothetical protein